MLATRTRLRTRAHIWHARVFTLAWPILISMLSYTAMTVSDSIFVGWLGTTPLAAIGLSATLTYLATAFGNGLLGGVRVTVAKAVGRSDSRRAAALGWQGVWLALGLGLPVAALAPLGASAFHWMGASTEVADLAGTYYSWRIVAAPVVFACTALTGWLQARGDTWTPMMATVAGNVANIVLDPLLIFGAGPVPSLGIQGAALATVLGQTLILVGLVLGSAPALHSAVISPRRDLVAAIARVGVPTGVEYTLNVASFTAFGAMLAQSGDAHLAAHVIAIRLLMVCFLPGLAVAQAASVLVGQALGAGQPRRARRAFRTAAVQATMIMTAVGITFLVIPDVLIGVFSPIPEVAMLTKQVLLVAAAIQLVDGVATTALSSLTGAGDTRFVMLLTVGSAWLVKLPLAGFLVLGCGLGVLGAWVGLAVECTVLATAASIRIGGSAWLTAGDDADPQEAVPRG